MLSEIEDGWLTLLDEEIDHARLTDRGAKLFEIAALLLGESDPRLGDAGMLTALMEAWRRGFGVVLDTAENQRIRLSGHRFPRRLRSLTGLARLAARDVKKLPDIEPEATPGRAAALLSHRLFGMVA